MTVEFQHIANPYEGKTRIALDEGAKSQITKEIAEARAQFSAAVENLVRTPEGESTHQLGHTVIGAYGGTESVRGFNKASQIINDICGMISGRQVEADKGRGRA